jgi:hypothetical protein
MAHFAEINSDNIVVQVIVVNNEVLLDSNGVEQEALGVAFCQKLLGGTWIQTSYNSTIRKNYAGSGYIYDSILDAFIPPEPQEGDYHFNEDTCRWELKTDSGI